MSEPVGGGGGSTYSCPGCGTPTGGGYCRPGQGCQTGVAASCLMCGEKSPNTDPSYIAHRIGCPNSSADKEVFGTGAHRSSTTAGATLPTDYSQISRVALRLMAETQAEGNKKYGVGNWQKGIPLSNLMSHAIAHIMAILDGDLTENHFGHALWNLEKAAHFYEKRPDMIDIKPLRDALIAKGIINQ